MKLIIILLGLGVLAYLIWDDRERYAQLRKFKRLVRKSRRQARKEPWLKIRNSTVNSRNAPDKNVVVLKRTKLDRGVILEFSFPEYRYNNLDIINITLSEYALKDVTVKEHTGALVATENRGSAADGGLQYALKTCTLQCDLMPSGPGLDLRINTMAADKSVKDCALVWQQRNPDRKLCKKVFRELKNAYVLVVVHHDKTRQLQEREIIPRDRKPKAGTARVSSGTVPVSSGRPSVSAPVSSGPVPVLSPAGPSQAASGKITVRQEGDTLYISGREILWPSHLVAYSEFKKVVLGPEIPCIGHAAFRGRTNLTAITIPDSVRIIFGDAFLGCTGLTQISIPGSVLEIADETFRGCTHLTSVTIANGVRKIGSGVFRGCTGLTDLVIPDSVEEIHEYAFHGCTNLRSIRISRAVKVIAKSTFKGCSSLTNIAIADGVVKIDREAFSGCTGLTNIVIPDSVLEIGKEAFSGCTGLTSLTIPTNCRRIGDNAFQDVPHIRYDGAVWQTDNWGAKAVTHPQGRKYFCGKPGKDTLVWHMVDDTLYIEGQGRLRCSENNWLPYKVRHVVIAPGCTAIADYAFCGHRNLESVTLPDTLRTIGQWAFAHCTGLKEIKIPDSVVGIGTGAFAECIRLQRIQLPEKLSQIHDDTFKYCRKLENVQIPDSVHYIGKYAFCKVRFVANLPGNLGNWGTKTPEYAKRGYGIGKGAFAEAGLPAHLEIPDRICTIPEQAFYECKTLVSVKFPNYMMEIGGYAFAGCKGLECLEIPKTVTKIGTNAFWRVRHIIYHGLAQSDDNWGAKYWERDSKHK